MPFSTQPPIPIKEKITVKYIVEKLRSRVNINLVCCAAEDCCAERYVREADLHRPGLALAGYIKLFTFQRIQIIGNTESQYLENKPKEEQIEAFKNLMQFQIPVIFLTDGNLLPDYLIELAEQAGIPIYRTPMKLRVSCSYYAIFWTISLRYKPWCMERWWMYMELVF